MKESIGCEDIYGVFFDCSDCKHNADPDACRQYRHSRMGAKIGFEIRG